MRNKKNLMLVVFVSGILSAEMYANTKQSYQPATVVSVANHETRSNYIGSPTDAPLEPQVYSYDIGIQVNCTVYVVRYDTPLDYLPSVFSPHQTVEISLQKHVMKVNLPGGRAVSLSIASRSQVRDTSCAVKN